MKITISDTEEYEIHIPEELDGQELDKLTDRLTRVSRLIDKSGLFVMPSKEEPRAVHTYVSRVTKAQLEALFPDREAWVKLVSLYYREGLNVSYNYVTSHGWKLGKESFQSAISKIRKKYNMTNDEIGVILLQQGKKVILKT